MAGVDNRIVTMKFDNAQFESGARTSLSTLQKLKEGMNFGSIGTAASKTIGGISGLFAKFGIKNPFATAEKGAADLGKAAQGVTSGGLTSMDGAVTGISNRFLALSTIAITALSNITTKAMQTGQQMVSSLTIDPVKAGLQEYETNLNSIQTILANTKVSGTGLPEVNAALEELNEYSDKTIYNFSEMARNIGTFTAAGVDLDTSVASIKGIANLAALSGSNSQQASTAMYQLSQEIAAGRVSLMGWNSVVNAGMGGSTFQRALVTTAQNMGTLKGRTVEFKGEMKNATIDGMSFRDSIMAKPGETSWLSKEVLTGTLAQFTNDMTDAELAAEGFTKAQIKDIQEMAKTAEDAATKVKTLSGVFDTAKEVVGSGWAKTWQLVFGDFKEARKFFTNFSNGFNDILGGIADKRNEVLSQWKLRGGRDLAIEGLGEMWKSILTIIRPIGRAFRDIFPATTARNLMDMTRNFVDFAKSLSANKGTMKDVRDIAGGIFAVFGIGKQLLGGVVTLFKTIFDTVGAGNGNFLDFGASVGNMVKNFNTFLEESGLITEFFSTLGGVLSVPLALLQGLAGIFSRIFSGFDEGTADKVGKGIDKVGDRLSGLAIVGENIRKFFSKIGDFFGNLGEYIGSALAGIGDVVAGAFTADTFGSTLDVINTTLLGGLVLLLRNFFNKGVNIDLTGGLFDGIKETLGEATGAFENMQNTLKADILLKLAVAIGVMAAALLVLSMIDPASLTKALVAMGAGFGVLITATATLMKVLGAAGLIQLYVVTSAMTKMAASILLLAFALKMLAGIDFAEMLRGLTGLAATMFILTKALVPLAAGSKGMARASFSLILVGIALNILAVALKIFASMSWEEMIKGLAGLTGVLAALVIGLKLMPPLQASALGLLALAVSMNVLAIALKIFATMSWVEMSKGLIMLAGALGIIALAMRLMPKGMIAQAVALNAVATAMVVLSGALKIFASMGWEEIAKGLVVLAGALIIIAVGLQAIGLVGTIGAVGLLAAAGALAILAPILVTLAALSWESLLKSLLGLAGLFTIIGVAGYLLTPVIPTILALGASMLLLGAGLAMAGAGAFLAATAFGIVVAAGIAGAQVLAHVLATIIAAIPPAMEAFAKGVVNFAVAIGKGAPKIGHAFGRVLSNLIDSVIKNTPRLAKAFLVMLNAALRVIVISVPRIVDAGLKLIIGFLGAVERNIGKIVDLAARIIVNFLDGIGRNIGKIIDAGVRLIIKFVEGVAKAIRDNDREMGEAGGDLAIAMVEGMANGIAGAAGRIKDAAMAAARAAWDEVKEFFKIGSPSKLMRDEIGARISQGMALGIKDDAPLVVKEIGEMGKTAVGKLDDVMSGVDDAFALDPNLNPTISPVLDLTSLTKEANKMSSILATAPIMAGVSYQTAADISAMTQASSEPDDGPDGPDSGGGGDHTTNLTLELHSPRPIDSVESYRAGKTLISLAKEALK